VKKSSPTPVLVCDCVAKDYGDGLGLQPLELTVGVGELVVLVGPNGAGKSTLLRLAAGLLEPTEGEVRVSGEPAGTLLARAATAWLPDNPVLYDDLSVDEHLEYVARLHGVEDWHDRAAELLDRLGLAHRADDLPSRFSRGLRQKTSLAIGFVRPSDLLLVDEPFVGLDQPGQAAMVELLVEAAAGGAAVVVSTHSLELVDRATRCVALRDGEKSFDGPPTRERILALVS
jgi:ABC-2 type transport system ATP-binding protein